MSRAAKPNEKPQFGQVWRYGPDGISRMVIGLNNIRLVTVNVDRDTPYGFGEVNNSMIWLMSDGRTMPKWELLDD